MTVSQNKNIIVHIPYCLAGRPSASQIRPLQIIHAFKCAGFEVDVISGLPLTRLGDFLKCYKKILAGQRYDFVYSESASVPMAMASGRKKFPLALVDAFFFLYFKFKRIPFGLFYRDIYWLFPDLRNNLGIVSRYIYWLFHWVDLLIYRLTVDAIFLPSIRMRKYMPPLFDAGKFYELPPGCNEINNPPPKKHPTQPLRLIYVGGLGNHYQLHKLFEAVAIRSGEVALTICCRQDDWNLNKSSYRKWADLPYIKIKHSSGDDLGREIQEHDICLLFVEPMEYWTFAVPMKLFDYISYHKPIIATKETYAGDLVTEHNLGWSIEYDERQMAGLLLKLLDPSLRLAHQEDIVRFAMQNRWKERALECAGILGQFKQN